MRTLKLNVANKNHFVLSGVLAVGFYLFTFILFALYVSAPKVEKFDALSKNTVLELEVFLAEDIKKDLRNKSDVKDTKKSQEVVKTSKSTTAKSKTSVKSLFANVKADSKKYVLEEVNNVKNSEVNSRFKAKFEKQRKNDVTVSKRLDNVKTKSVSLPKSNAVGKTDPYYSKIHDLLYQRWNPQIGEGGLVAKVLVMISADGVFDFRFMSRSDNDLFNEELNQFLSSQRFVTYPQHNKGRMATLEVDFKKDN